MIKSLVALEKSCQLQSCRFVCVTSIKNSMQEVLRIFKRTAFITGARIVKDYLSLQCQEYKKGFDICVEFGWLLIFDFNHGAYAEDKIEYQLQRIPRDGPSYKGFTVHAASRHVYQILKNILMRYSID